MNGDNNRWIKLYCKLIDDPLLSDAIRLGVWVHILLSVNRNETTTFFAGKKVVLKPGQGIFSTPELSKKLNISVSMVRRILKMFENEQQIEQQPTNQGTVITVLHWHKYQVSEQQNEQRVNNGRTTDEQRMNNLPIIQEYKELNNTNVLLSPSEDGRTKSEKYQPILEAWNSLPVTPIRDIKNKRLEQLRARIRECSFDDVLKAIENIRNSPFLLGKNSRGWQIKFDWFVMPNNFQKVLEGNYNQTPIPEKPAEQKMEMPKQTIPFMEIVNAYKEAQKNGETRSLNEFGQEYRLRKQGENVGTGTPA